jgi:arylsulfatase A-like enzyme
MSAYGYPRRTTPNLERLAAEGALFERAYSNSTWSKPSTMSFMTSLQHSVLGGMATPTDPVPEEALTMAQHLHRAGYQTAVLTSNTWCGTMSGLEREVDLLRETIPGSNSTSSTVLQESFWRWRDAYPGEPYWVHFQMTDVHWPWEPVAPVAGVFLSPEERTAFQEMERRLAEAEGVTGRAWGLRVSGAMFERAGVDRKAYFAGVRGAYDEALAHNDAQLGRLVEGLKARGEWERTLLIVMADHGDWPGLGLFDVWDPEARVPFLNPYITRVPLVMVWPGKIPQGRRIPQAVSLVDLLPTVLELTGRQRPAGPAAFQGQSLAPLLFAQPGWKPRPVVLDEFTADPKTGKLTGAIEMIDGRWGASLAVGEESGGGPRLLLYDLLNDPYCLRSLHRERPGLVKTYTARLERQLREHRALAKRFSRGTPGALDAEQLRTLQSLGYVHLGRFGVFAAPSEITGEASVR